MWQQRAVGSRSDPQLETRPNSISSTVEEGEVGVREDHEEETKGDHEETQQKAEQQLTEESEKTKALQEREDGLMHRVAELETAKAALEKYYAPILWHWRKIVSRWISETFLHVCEGDLQMMSCRSFGASSSSLTIRRQGPRYMRSVCLCVVPPPGGGQGGST